MQPALLHQSLISVCCNSQFFCSSGVCCKPQNTLTNSLQSWYPCFRFAEHGVCYSECVWMSARLHTSTGCCTQEKRAPAEDLFAALRNETTSHTQCSCCLPARLYLLYYAHMFNGMPFILSVSSLFMSVSASVTTARPSTCMLFFYSCPRRFSSIVFV